MNLLKMKRMGVAFWVLALAASAAFSQTPAQNVTNKFDGVVFADYYYNMKNGVPANKYQDAFTIRRIYFTWENNLTADIKWRFRLESESNAYGNTTKINPFVKHAYLEWANLIPNHMIYLGIAETNAFKNSEEYWGYRSIEKTIMDLNKISSSADLGIALKGDLSAKYLHHWLTVMNGTGYGAAEGDRYKKIGYALWVTPVRGLIIEGYVDYEKQGPADLQTATAMSAAKDYALATSYNTLKGFVGYRHPRFTVGVEGLQRTNVGSGVESATAKYDSTAKKYKATNVTVEDIVRFGWSAFGSWITPVKNLKLFARYDSYDNNTGDNAFTKFDETKGKLGGGGLDDETSMLITGLDYIPSGNVHIMPNIMIKKYAAGAKKEDDTTARLTLYVKFDSGKVYGE